MMNKFFPTETTLFLSFSLFIDAYDPGTETFLSFFPYADTLPNITIQLTATGTLVVRRGDFGDTVLGTSTETIPIDEWVRMEFKIVFNDTTGSIEIKMNQLAFFELTSQDTLAVARTPIGCAGVSFHGLDGGGIVIFDDIIIHNDQGDEPTDFIGDVRIHTVRPDGAGDSSDSTPSAGLRHDAVDEQQLDNDTTYVSMSTAANKDLYTCADVPGGGAIEGPLAVVVNGLTRADGTTPRTVKMKIKENVTEGDGGTNNVNPGAAYTSQQGIFLNNPDTAAPWTESELNAMQIGIEVVA
jgi:hypothetical protein